MDTQPDPALPTTPPELLREAVRRIGGQSATARLCGVAQASVAQWLRKARPSPARFALKLEAATGISRHDLRPDIYPRDGGGAAVVAAGGGGVAFDSAGVLKRVGPVPVNDNCCCPCHRRSP